MTPIASDIVLQRGVSTDQTGLSAEFSCWEIFLHLDQPIRALRELLDTIANFPLAEACPADWSQFNQSNEIVKLSRWCLETTFAVAVANADKRLSEDPVALSVAMHNASVVKQVLDQMREQLGWNLDQQTWSIFFEAMARTAAPSELLTADTAAFRFAELVHSRKENTT